MTTHLFHISDVHFGAEDRAALAALETAIAVERPDALLCTGDLTQRAKKSEYAAAAEWFAGLGVPVVLDPGNHDMPYYNLWERFTDPYKRYRSLHTRVGGVLESEHVVLVPLKTTVRAQLRFPWSDGVVTRAALDRTLEILETMKHDGRTVIVTAHHPLLGPEMSDKNPTRGGHRAFAAIAAAGAHAVISGHVHVPFDGVRSVAGQEMRTIGTGTLSTRLRDNSPASYRVLKCRKGGEIDTEVRIARIEGA